MVMPWVVLSTTERRIRLAAVRGCGIGRRTNSEVASHVRGELDGWRPLLFDSFLCVFRATGLSAETRRYLSAPDGKPSVPGRRLRRDAAIGPGLYRAWSVTYRKDVVFLTS